jgi:hypothetical protein
MRLRQLFALVACAGLFSLGTVLTPTAGAQRTLYKGQFQCDDRGAVTGLAGMNVELWKRGENWLPVEWVGSRVDQGFTDSDGNFRMETPESEDNYFVRMALRDAHGVHLRDFWGINDWSVDAEQKRNNVRTHDYGGILFTTPGQSHKCAIWAGVRAAYERYRNEVGADLPWHGVEIQADAVTGGTPFTPGTSILWPGGYKVGHGDEPGRDDITRHEFGHVIRHGLDGDFGHFVGDAATFNYAQNHEPCSLTNAGYAFNEGWAEFWAGDYFGAPDCGRPGNMDTEGNVAAALVELMENCAGGQRKLMVENLQRNPQRIHSFAEFRDHLGCPIPRFIPVYVVAAKSFPPAPIVSASLRAAAARKEVRATSKRVKGLEKRLDVAIEKAEDPPTCAKDPCKKALKTLTRPAAIEFEVKLARIQLNAAAQYDAESEQAHLASIGIDKLFEAQDKQESRDRRKTIRAALTGVEDALDAARPVFKADKSKSTKKLHRTLAKAAARFRKASRKGTKGLPGGLLLQPAAFQLPKEGVPLIPPTPQTPIPGPTLLDRTATSLTIASCPANTASPKPIEVAGSMSPAQAGSEVRVTFSPPAGTPVVVVTTTDAAGAWSASHTPPPNATGTWSVTASFAGDGKRLASSSAACLTKYS